MDNDSHRISSFSHAWQKIAVSTGVVTMRELGPKRLFDALHHESRRGIRKVDCEAQRVESRIDIPYSVALGPMEAEEKHWHEHRADR